MNMKPTAIIGNSQLAALQQAINEQLYTEGDDLVFWGAPRDNFRGISFQNGFLEVGNRTIAKKISGGLYEKLPVGDFDALVFHSGTLGTRFLLKSFLRAGCNPMRLSGAFFDRSLQDLVDSDPVAQVVLTVRQAVDVPIVVSATPLMSKNEFGPEASAYLSACLEFLTQKVSDFWFERGVHHVPQPAQTIADGATTEESFSIGSVRLARPDATHNIADSDHMNGFYGALVLQDIQKCLGR